jgi:hypothetical protein
MAWRELMIKALITLIVTTLGGVMVWVLTREPKSEIATENLVYSFSNVATFGTGENRVRFLTLKLSNKGAKAAHIVKVVMLLPPGTRIRDKYVSLSTTLISAFQTSESSDARRLEISLPSLAPKEVLSVSALIEGGGDNLVPEIGIRSQETVAIEASDEDPTPRLKDELKLPLVILVIGSALVAQAFLFGFLRMRMRLREERHSINNTGFIYLQQGFVVEAQRLFEHAIHSNGAHPILYSNYALALGAQGNMQQALKMMDGADWWASSNHERAVIKFNRALLMLFHGNIGSAKKFLYDAFQMQRNEIARYCRLSTHIQKAVAENDDIRHIVEKRGKISA